MAQFTALAALLVGTVFFPVSETAMMAGRHIRLRRKAQNPSRHNPGAAPLGTTDQLPGAILLGRTPVNSIAASQAI